MRTPIPSIERAGRPVVSVVIIFLNAQKFIREAIESVRAQTYSEWELLLVDDGSTDASTEIARSYAGRSPSQIRYFEHEGHVNRGMSASRNVGIAQAHGEVVAFLDADDIWLPDKLGRQIEILKRHPHVGLIAGRAMYWYEDGTRVPQPMELSPGAIPAGAWLPKFLANTDNASCPSAVVIRKELAQQLGGFEEWLTGPGMVVEDQAMWSKVTLAGPIYYDPECVVLYRIHQASCCWSTPPRSQLQALGKFYAWLVAYIKHRNQKTDRMQTLTLMSQAKLCDVLLQSLSVEHDGTGGNTDPALPSPTARQLVRTYAPLLGRTMTAVLLVGTISVRIASAIAKRLFAAAVIAYEEGRPPGVRDFARQIRR